MSWFAGDSRTLLQKIFAKILVNGPIPRHVGIIMDGNRRFAKSKNMEKIEGHKSGFQKLTETLSWCFMMNIREISVYAFSIENFKRSKEEVDNILDLARDKLKEMINEESKMKQLGLCVRFFGNIKYLPDDLQVVIAEITLMTKNNKNFFLNFCFSYTSRDEMSTSIKDVNEGILNKYLQVTDINDTIIENALFTNQSFKVDLMIRTSGEVRLSDFLLWQSNMSTLAFDKKTWPEFTIWSFYMSILKFQLNYKNIQSLRTSQIKQRQELEKKLNYLPSSDELIKHINKSNVNNCDELIILTKSIVFYSKKKEIERFNSRCELFYRKLLTKRENFFKSLMEQVTTCKL